MAFAAALACLLPLPDLLAAPVNTYASAIALEELAKAATAEAYSLRHFRHVISLSSHQPFDDILRPNREIEIGEADALSDRRKGFNGLKRRLYLSSDPWGPFRRLYVFAGCWVLLKLDVDD